MATLQGRGSVQGNLSVLHIVCKFRVLAFCLGLHHIEQSCFVRDCDVLTVRRRKARKIFRQ